MIVEYLGIYFKEFFVLTNSMAPYLLLGFFFAGLLHIFFKKEQVARLLGSRKVKSSIYASLIGVPLPLCSCGVIPTGISIYKSGASKGSTVSFLISTPQTGVDSIFATYSMLGLPFAILRPLVAFVSGIIGGSITNRLDKESEHESQNTFSTAEEPVIKNPVKRMLHYGFVESLQDIAKWLIIGLLIATFISVLLPPDFFQKYITNDILGMLLVLVVAVPLYICATGSIPIAAVLIMKGISPGAALVFLMAGPATNAATITVLGKVMGKKALAGYLISIIGSALVFGLLIDNFLPREWFTTSMTAHHHDMNHGLPFWFEISSSVILVLLILNIYIRKISKFFKGKYIQPSIAESDNREHAYTYIKVGGLDCNHCKSNIENNLGSVKGIVSVEADINNSTVKIKGNGFDLNQVKETIESLGHQFQGIVHDTNNHQMEKIKIIIKGMTCNHCKANVEKTIRSIQNISNATVDLDSSSAVIEGENIDTAELKKRIEDIGYEFGGLVV